jgi:hypothetical protein
MKPIIVSLLSLAAAASLNAEPARFVRIEIPGEKKCLQIAEIEIMSGGKNVAKGGKATQSTTRNGGDASKALDGDKNPAWGKGMTHTQENQPNPWWEVDLGSARLWTRSAFGAARASRIVWVGSRCNCLMKGAKQCLKPKTSRGRNR